MKYQNLVHYLEHDRVKGDWDRMIIGGATRRLEIPLVSDQQIRKAGKILEELGRGLQLISRRKYAERTILIEATQAIYSARQRLKRQKPRPKTTSR
jgi:hypothetical protein